MEHFNRFWIHLLKICKFNTFWKVAWLIDWKYLANAYLPVGYSHLRKGRNICSCCLFIREMHNSSLSSTVSKSSLPNDNEHPDCIKRFHDHAPISFQNSIQVLLSQTISVSLLLWVYLKGTLLDALRARLSPATCRSW